MPHQVDLEPGWAELKHKGIDELIAKAESGFRTRFSNEEYMKLYRLCYHMATQKSPANWSAKLYERHGESIREYLRDRVLPAVRAKQDQFLLRELVLRWNNHRLMNKWLDRLFAYLNRFYVTHHNVPTLLTSGLIAFQEEVFVRMQKDFTRSVLKEIRRDRDGEAVDRDLLRHVVDIYIAMGMGKLTMYSQLEEALLAATDEYYAGKSQSMISRLSTPEYLIEAEKALKAEDDRLLDYLDGSSRDALLARVEDQLLKKHKQQLLERPNGGVASLLEERRLGDLARMSRLFQRVENGLVSIADTFKQFVARKGEALVVRRETQTEALSGGGGGGGGGGSRGPTRSEIDMGFIKSMLGLHDEMLQLVVTQFQGSTLFQKALKTAFEGFFNREVKAKSTNVEALARYADMVLRGGTSSDRFNDERAEAELESIVHVFAFVAEKDVFALHHRQLLAKRLLQAKSASDVTEKSMLSKLKLRCGHNYTSKMEGMIKDLSVGATYNGKFQDFMRDPANHIEPIPLEFSVQMLTKGFWPTYRDVSPTLPAEFAKCLTAFEAHYVGEHKYRKVTWMHTLGKAEVRAFLGKEVIVHCGTLQAIFLLYFNKATGPVDIPKLSADLGVTDDVARRVLHSLACTRFPVIKKSSSGGAISKSDTFTPNVTFTCRQTKISIPAANLDESSGTEKVQVDRTHVIEALVVRIMKARKTMKHQELVGEVMSHATMFEPDSKMIKQRIEGLIERDYLERDDNDPHLFRYLA